VTIDAHTDRQIALARSLAERFRADVARYPADADYWRTMAAGADAVANLLADDATTFVTVAPVRPNP
jgi:hypothetical protein